MDASSLLVGTLKSMLGMERLVQSITCDGTPTHTSVTFCGRHILVPDQSPGTDGEDREENREESREENREEHREDGLVGSRVLSVCKQYVVVKLLSNGMSIHMVKWRKVPLLSPKVKSP